MGVVGFPDHKTELCTSISLSNRIYLKPHNAGDASCVHTAIGGFFGAEPSRFTLYVDEAGDPGLKTIRGRTGQKGSKWFVLAGVLVRSQNIEALRQWPGQMLASRRLQAKTLHFRKLNLHNRLRVAESASALPARAFVVASNKISMYGHKNPRAAIHGSKDPFYNWCIRILLERVCEAVARSNARNGLPNIPIDIVFSNRGGHDYSHLFAYLSLLVMQAKSGTTCLKKRVIVPDLIGVSGSSYKTDPEEPALSVADTVASAVFQALEHGNVPGADRAARVLFPLLAKKSGSPWDMGIIRQPNPYQLRSEPWELAFFEFMRRPFVPIRKIGEDSGSLSSILTR